MCLGCSLVVGCILAKHGVQHPAPLPKVGDSLTTSEFASCKILSKPNCLECYYLKLMGSYLRQMLFIYLFIYFSLPPVYVGNFQLNFNFHIIMRISVSLFDKLESQSLELLPRVVEQPFGYGSSKPRVFPFYI